MNAPTTVCLSILEQCSIVRHILKSIMRFSLNHSLGSPIARHQPPVALTRVLPIMLSAALLLGFGPMAHADHDNDGIPDAEDNCTNSANPAQRDTDGDGYGNLCDMDLNNDGVVNLSDHSLFRSVFGSDAPNAAPYILSDHADADGDGFVNLSDFSVMRSMFGQNPGPSAIPASGGDQTIIVSWVAPAFRVNGESLSLNELDRYEIYASPTNGGSRSVFVVADPNISSYQLSGLVPGTYECSMVAVDTSGNVSEPSSPLSFTVI